MKKEIKLTCLKKAKKFLTKHGDSITEKDVDILVVIENEIIIESIIEDIDFRENIY